MDKFVLGDDVSPEMFNVELCLAERVALAVVGSTEELDITMDEQLEIAEAVMSAIEVHFQSVMDSNGG